MFQCDELFTLLHSHFSYKINVEIIISRHFKLYLNYNFIIL